MYIYTIYIYIFFLYIYNIFYNLHVLMKIKKGKFGKISKNKIIF